MNNYTKTLTQNLQEYSLDYEELSVSAKNLIQLHNELECSIRSTSTVIERGIAKLRRYLGAPRPSVEYVLSKQMEILHALRKNVEMPYRKGERELDNLVTHSRDINARIMDNLKFRKKEHPVIIQIKNELVLQSAQLGNKYKDLQSKFFSSEDIELDEEYSKSKLEHEDKYRLLLNKQHDLDIVTVAASDYLGQKKSLRINEELLRNTTHTSHHIIEKTKRIEEQIGKTKGIYDSVFRQQKAYIYLHDALCAQRSYIQGLDNIIIVGQQTMNDISARSQALNAFYENPNMENIRELIHFQESDKRSDLEDKLKENLDNEKPGK